QVPPERARCRIVHLLIILDRRFDTLPVVLQRLRARFECLCCGRPSVLIGRYSSIFRERASTNRHRLHDRTNVRSCLSHVPLSLVKFTKSFLCLIRIDGELARLGRVTESLCPLESRRVLLSGAEQFVPADRLTSRAGGHESHAYYPPHAACAAPSLAGSGDRKGCFGRTAPVGGRNLDDRSSRACPGQTVRRLPLPLGCPKSGVRSTTHSRWGASARCTKEAIRRLSPGCKVTYGGSPSMVVNHRPGQYARSLHSNRRTPYSLAGNLDELNVLLLVSAMARSDSRSAPCPHAAVPERRRSFAMTLSSSAA